MATQATPIGVKGTGSIEVTDPVLISKALRLRAIKKAKDQLDKEVKSLTNDLNDAVIELGHEQFTLDGEPILTADEKEYTSLDKEYLARRAPVALARATSKSFGLALNTSPTALPR